MGVGMVALVDPDDVNRVLDTLSAHEVDAWVAGETAMAADVAGRTPGSVVLEGAHPGW
jgi:phosphoribosylformylglycinamidine cyclo-ligase